jgi:hypothetical protein
MYKKILSLLVSLSLLLTPIASAAPNFNITSDMTGAAYVAQMNANFQAVNWTAPISFTGDFHSQQTAGYYVTSAVGQTNAPNATDKFNLTVQVTGSYIYHQAVDTVTGISYFETYNGSTWSGWNQVLTGGGTNRNKIINGDMVIDQRFAGVGQTAISTGYILDRFFYASTQTGKFNAQQNAGSITPPSGFTNYLGLTVNTAYTVASTDFFEVGQRIEGSNCRDLSWGTANAKPISLSFWVYSSLTGTFSGALENNVVTNYTYPFTYTISSANTWTYVTIPVTGCTSGTWLTTNGTVGMLVVLNLGSGSSVTSSTASAWQAGNYAGTTGSVSVVGTSGATFYVTGLQLEKGMSTPFEFLPIQNELSLCQRYFETSYPIGTAPGTSGNTSTAMWNVAITAADFYNYGATYYKVPKCYIPTVTGYSPSTGAGSTYWCLSTSASNGSFGLRYSNTLGFEMYNTSSSWTAGWVTGIHWTASAEL